MTLVAVGSLLLINLTKRHEMQKAHNRLILEENKSKLKQRILDLEQKKTALEAAKAILAKAKADDADAKAKAKQALLDEKMSNDAMAIKVLSEENVSLKEAEAHIDAELLSTNAELKGARIDMLNTEIQLQQNAAGIGEI